MKKVLGILAIIFMLLNVVIPTVFAEEAVQAELQSDASNATVQSEPEEIGIEYTTHVQDIGWQDWKADGELAGTEGKSLRLEAIKIKLINNEDIKLKYQVHAQNVGWQNWKTDGELAGTQGQSLRLEAIKIELENSEDYSIMYRVHVQDIGWQDWKIDGELAGTEGKSLRLEAIQIKIVEKVKKAKITVDSGVSKTTYYDSDTSINISGWRMANFSNNEIRAYIDDTMIDASNITYIERSDVLSAIVGYGTKKENPTPGFKFNVNLAELEEGNHTIRINVVTKDDEVIETYSYKFKIDRQLHISYQGQVQNIGWQNSVMDGNLAGTEGKSYRLEALKIQLINAPEGAKVNYRAHVQNVGWQNWSSDGEITGTVGRGLRLEAIQIKLEGLDEYTVEYRVHVQDIGWTDWYIDGETAGTVGKGKRIEAIKIRLVTKYKRSYTGIDVSKHNGTIDWQKVKNSGIEFAIIRCGYGQNLVEQDDSKFEYNVSECERLGIPYGVYLYSYALNTANASSEADHVLRLVNGRNPQLGIWLDVEDDEYYTKYGFPTNEMFINIITTFCEKIKANGYDNVGIYSNLTWLNGRLNDSRLDKYDKWVAQWGNECTYKKDYAMWQYSDSGQVNGISGNVDMDICYKKYF